MASVRRLPRLDEVIVLCADDQVPGARAVGDTHRVRRRDGAEADQVIADAAGQLPAQRMIGRHQQHVGAVQREREVVGRGGVHHLLRLTAADPGVLVVVGQHRGVSGAEPQARCLFPLLAEPDRLGQLREPQGISEQRHTAAASTAWSCCVSPARITLTPLSAAWAIRSARSGLATMDASSTRTTSPGWSGAGPRAPRCPGRWPRNCAAL